MYGKNQDDYPPCGDGWRRDDKDPLADDQGGAFRTVYRSEDRVL